MPIFEIQIETVAVVIAEDAAHAVEIVSDEMLQIVSDAIGSSLEVHSGTEIESLDELPRGWDPMCIPYGGDGDTRLKDLLPETQP
jgi:hypothetical protein